MLIDARTVFSTQVLNVTSPPGASDAGTYSIETDAGGANGSILQELNFTLFPENGGLVFCPDIVRVSYLMCLLGRGIDVIADDSDDQWVPVKQQKDADLLARKAGWWWGEGSTGSPC